MKNLLNKIYSNFLIGKLNLKFLFVAFIVLTSTSINSQTIKGVITNNNKYPLEFVTVTLKCDTSFSKVVLTDSTGSFNIDRYPLGKKCLLSISFIGYDNIDTIFISQSNIVFNFTLNVTSKQLKSITVTSKKPLIERKIDRLVFNVENSISAEGGTALDVLAKTPGVRVNNDAISLIGKSGVNVLIDDKLNPLSGNELSNFLKSISSDDIAKIEVITNPPAKYDAQGNNGLINIVLKRNKKLGYSGSANIDYTQTTYSTILGGLNFNYNKNSFRFYSTINASNGAIRNIGNYNVFYPEQTWLQETNNKNNYKFLTGRVGIEYNLSKSTLLAFEYNGGFSNIERKENIATSIYNKLFLKDSTVKTLADNTTDNNRSDINFHLQHNIDATGKKLTIDGDWFNYYNQNNRPFSSTTYYPDNQIIPNSYLKYISQGNQNINLYTIKADVDLPFKKYSLSFGGKLTFTNDLSSATFFNWENNLYVQDTTQSNKFKYNENVQALYASFNKSFKKWELKIGLRGELTEIKGHSITTNQTNTSNYLRTFPTLYLSYKLNDKNIFSLNYGKRISRPSYWFLNPFRWNTSIYSYTEGNPYLQPSYNHNIEASYTYNNFYTTSLSFSYKQDDYEQFTFIDSITNIQKTYPLNFLTGYQYQWMNSVNFSKIKWWEFDAQFQLYYKKSVSSIPQTQRRIEGWGAYFSCDNQFSLNKKKTIMASLNFWYQFPETDQIDVSNSYYNVDAGLKFLLNDRFQITINATDIFKTDKCIWTDYTNGMKIQFYDYWDYRSIKISLRYKFGNNKIRHEERQLSNTDEINRVK